MQCNFSMHSIHTYIHIYCYFDLNHILKVLLRTQNLYPDLCTPVYVEKNFKIPTMSSSMVTKLRGQITHPLQLRIEVHFLIWQHSELTDTFLVGNHWHHFLGRI